MYVQSTCSMPSRDQSMPNHEVESPPPERRLLDLLRRCDPTQTLTATETEQSYVHWVRRFVFFHASAIHATWVLTR